MPLSNPPSFGFPNCNITYEYSRMAMLSPLCLAASRGLTEIRDLDLALFLANRSGHIDIVALLLGKRTNPLRESSANGLYGAAWRGLNEEISAYIRAGYADPDVFDGSSATPVIYAILGTQDEQGAWETIKCLFNLGASPWNKFGREDNDVQSDNERPPEVPEAKGGADAICEASCTGGQDNDVQPDNERPREDSGTDRGTDTSRNSSCTAGVGTDGQSDNKRPRGDSGADGEAKRARIA
ncbi:hypothetical protein DER45DRAFT_587799 [Fusarium avenaceum]|nr:hypothetical protein DER45DRAFT_587799 [Fusarium avenaceum]